MNNNKWLIFLLVFLVAIVGASATTYVQNGQTTYAHSQNARGLAGYRFYVNTSLTLLNATVESTVAVNGMALFNDSNYLLVNTTIDGNHNAILNVNLTPGYYKIGAYNIPAEDVRQVYATSGEVSYPYVNQYITFTGYSEGVNYNVLADGMDAGTSTSYAFNIVSLTVSVEAPADTTNPQYTDYGTNVTGDFYLGQSDLIFSNWTDDVALSMCIVQETMPNSTAYNTTEYLNLTSGVCFVEGQASPVGTHSFKFFVNDTSNNWNVTPSFDLIVLGLQSPQWSDFSVNSTAISIGGSIKYAANWTDDIQLGYYIPSIGNTTYWWNSSAISFGAGNTSVRQTEIDIVGIWQVKFFANNSNNNWNVTNILNVTVTDDYPQWYGYGTNVTAPYYQGMSNKEYSNWTDNYKISSCTLQETFPNLTSVNYSDAGMLVCAVDFIDCDCITTGNAAPIGNHTFKWFVNDSSNQWNSTPSYSYIVIQPSDAAASITYWRVSPCLESTWCVNGNWSILATVEDNACTQFRIRAFDNTTSLFSTAWYQHNGTIFNWTLDTITDDTIIFNTTIADGTFVLEVSDYDCSAIVPNGTITQQNFSFVVADYGCVDYDECYSDSIEYEVEDEEIDGESQSIITLIEDGIGDVSASMGFAVRGLYYIFMLLAVLICWYFLRTAPLAAIIVSAITIMIMSVFGVLMHILSATFLFLVVVISGFIIFIAFKVIK